jgi:hypothetical protein
MTYKAPKAGKEKTGFRAILKKTFHHSGKGGSKKAEEKEEKDLVATVEAPPETNTSEKKPIAVVTSQPVDDPAADDKKGPTVTEAPEKHSGKARRLQAEKRLQEAGTALSKAMSKTSEKPQVPESISLQHIETVNDVATTAKELETAIDGIIDARALRASADSRNVWKACVRGWFKASYPYVKTCLEGINVRKWGSYKLT